MRIRKQMQCFITLKWILKGVLFEFIVHTFSKTVLAIKCSPLGLMCFFFCDYILYLLSSELRHGKGTQLYTISCIPTTNDGCLSKLKFCLKIPEVLHYYGRSPCTSMKHSPPLRVSSLCGTWRCVTLFARLFHWVSHLQLGKYSSYINTLF